MRPFYSALLASLMPVVIVAFLMILDRSYLPTPAGGTPLETGQVSAAYVSSIELTKDAAALMSTYALSILGVLGFFLKSRVTPEDKTKAVPLDAWEFTAIGVTSILAIVVMYLGLTVPLSIAQMLSHDFLELTDKSVESVVAWQATLLLGCVALLWGFLGYQAIVKRP